MNALLASPWVEAAGWTLIHSIWQGIMIALFASGLVQATRGRTSRLNYTIYCVALFLTVLVSLSTFALKLPAARSTSLVSNLAPGVAADLPGATVPASNTAAAFPASDLPAPTTLDRAMPFIVITWAAGVLLMSVRLLAGAVWIRRLARTATVWQNEEWQQKLRQWRASLGIRPAVKLCTTLLSEVPAVIGFFKPVVLLPASIITQLTPEQLEAVILHELMHIRRHDYFVNLLQICCETVLFFNPAVWWLSRSIRLEREHCCDESVAQHLEDKIHYAKALVRLEELRLNPVNSLALAASGSSLKRRVTRLLRTERASLPHPFWSGATLVLIVAGVVLAFAWRPALADEKPKIQFELHAVVEDGKGVALPLKTRDHAPSKLSVSPEVLMDNRSIASVELEDDPASKQPSIKVRLTKQGGDLFAKITREHINRQIAIVLDKSIVSAPVIRTEIPGGIFVITGDFTSDEAADLAKKLQPKNNTEGSTTEPDQPQAWTPPPGAVPSAVLKDVRTAIASGKYEQALAQLLWYFPASRQEPGQGGVRLSFALSDWLNLGRLYPPALAKMKELRDETGRALRKRDIAVDSFASFQEYAALNETLREEAKTAELFEWFDANDPEVAQQIFRVAEPALIKTGSLKLCEKYVSGRDFDSILSSFQWPRERIGASGLDGRIKELGEERFRNQTGTLIWLLVHKGDRAGAEQVASRARTAFPNDELDRVITAALRGDGPETWSRGPNASRPSRDRNQANQFQDSSATALEKARKELAELLLTYTAGSKAVIEKRAQIAALEKQLQPENRADDTQEERALLEKEIELAKQSLTTLERQRERGRASSEEIAPHQQEVLRLELELAWMKNDRAAMTSNLDRQIGLIDERLKIQRKKIENGVEPPDSLIAIERELLHVQRQLAAVKNGRSPFLPGRSK